MLVGVSQVDRVGLRAALDLRGVRLCLAEGDDGGRWDAVLCGHRLEPNERIARWRRHWAGPLIMLARDQGQAVALLDGGADDVIVDEACDALVAARIAAFLRRRSATRLQVGTLVMNPVDRHASRAGIPLALLPREYELLLYLAQRPGLVVGRRELLDRIWRLPFDPGTNVIEAHVSRLRAKLDRGFAAPMLRTERGRGYRLVAD